MTTPTSPPPTTPSTTATRWDDDPPVRLRARLDPATSRWLWLVKWLLLLPHVLVLAVLWLVFTVLTVVAGVTVLVTGEYPRSIFDLNLGILRWTWRVWCYGYGALATDRYPPFSLGEEPDYPATLDIDPPTGLNRWLVLVKWLLALPHLVIVGVFTGGAGWAVGWFHLGGGLVGLLAVVTGAVLLFTGSYPRSLFDLLVGLNRWVVRVGAYTALMTDRYPPFRLDQGGDEREPALVGP